jgi:uncharacterized protein YdhG (YjbR/CyaY superfamily)
LAGYATASGTVRFELDEPIPYALIGRITKFRVKEERELAKLKASKKKK